MPQSWSVRTVAKMLRDHSDHALVVAGGWRRREYDVRDSALNRRRSLQAWRPKTADDMRQYRRDTENDAAASVNCVGDLSIPALSQAIVRRAAQVQHDCVRHTPCSVPKPDALLQAERQLIGKLGPGRKPAAKKIRIDRAKHRARQIEARTKGGKRTKHRTAQMIYYGSPTDDRVKWRDELVDYARTKFENTTRRSESAEFLRGLQALKRAGLLDGRKKVSLSMSHLLMARARLLVSTMWQQRC